MGQASAADNVATILSFLLKQAYNVANNRQAAGIILLSHVCQRMLRWQLSLMLVYHTICVRSLVPVWPAEMTLWQSWE